MHGNTHACAALNPDIALLAIAYSEWHSLMVLWGISHPSQLLQLADAPLVNPKVGPGGGS